MAPARTRRLRVLIPVLATLVASAAWQGQTAPARAVVRQTPPTTTNLLQDLLNQLIPTTTAPSPAPAEASTQPSADDAPAPPLPSDLTPAADGAPLIPQTDWVPGGGQSTQPLLDALGVLRNIGFTEEEAIALGMGHFPVGGLATYTAGFGEPRGDHIHQGVDILAARGTLVRAPSEGVLAYSEGGGYGKAAAVTGVDGITYFMAHLDDFAQGLSGGSTVKPGQTVGYVGSTGNATTTHVHFEVRPRGGAAIDPKPYLDAWLNEAVAAVPGILALFAPNSGAIPGALLAAGLLRRFDPRPAGVLAEPSRLLSAATSDPRADADAWLEARGLALAVIAPLTPPALHDVLARTGD